jgi:hypothetical protein
MPVQARRIFRLSATVALALVGGYGLQLPLPYLAPIFALILTIAPAPPMGWKKLIALVLVVCLTLGIGLLLIPILENYAISAVLLVGLGLYLSFYLTVNKGQALIGLFLTIGFTLISTAGTVSFALALLVIQSLVLGILIAIICQWLVYPWFPEDPRLNKQQAAADKSAAQSNWIALRGALIVLPTYLLALSNPSMYLPVIMKSVTLGQQSSSLSARNAGWELLGSTFLGGCFAILFWLALGALTNLWMFFLWTLLFTIYFASKIYGLLVSRFPASFWQNVAVTLLILLGSAVADSENGKDVYTAFFVRMGLFIAVTLYAWLAVYLLDYLRARRRAEPSNPESSPC